MCNIDEQKSAVKGLHTFAGHVPCSVIALEPGLLKKSV
jgi:hypothetical protein